MFISIHYLHEDKVTSDESQVKLNHIIGFFVEVKFVGSDVGVLSSLVEIAFDHLQESNSISVS